MRLIQLEGETMKNQLVEKILALAVTRALPLLLAAIGGWLLANYPEAHNAICTGLQ